MMKSAFRVADWQFHRPPETVKLSRGVQWGVGEVGGDPSPWRSTSLEAPSVGERTDRDGEITHTNWEGAKQASPPRLPANCLIG